jgi:MATE family multidrug resistance protein
MSWPEEEPPSLLQGGDESKPSASADGPPRLWAELKATLKLAGPLVLNQVGHMSMGMVDTMVAGKIGTAALAGLGLGANFFWTFTSVCVGCLLALDTYFSQAVGAKDQASMNRYLGQAWWSAGMVLLASGAMIVAGILLYLWFTPASAMRDSCATYVWNILWCLPTLFIYFILQRYWQARRRILPFTVIILAANVLNLGACLAFGLGYWGFPRLEVRGLALATVASRYAMLAAALLFTWYQLRPRSLRPAPISRAVQRDIFRLGLPAAGHTALEIGAFTIATFVVGALGAVPLAAHHVCLMMAAFTFMFPLGFSAAAAVRVGTFVGAGQPARARYAGWVCIGVSVTVMSAFALVYFFFRRSLLGLFTSDAAVVEIGARILLLVALFQIADGTQVSTTGALRGIGNTRSAMIANLIGHYPVGLALGLFLCFGLNLGALGLWGGLAAGLISVALILLRAWSWATRDLSRIIPVGRATT